MVRQVSDDYPALGIDFRGFGSVQLAGTIAVAAKTEFPIAIQVEHIDFAIASLGHVKQVVGADAHKLGFAILAGPGYSGRARSRKRQSSAATCNLC